MERSELKKHSTRNVILRVDYIPLADEQADKIKSIFAEKFITDEIGFTQFNESFINNIDIQINDISDPNIQDSSNFLNIKNNSTRTKSFEYIMEENGNAYLKLLFNKYFLALEIIQDNKYCKFEDYKSIFINALQILKDEMTQALKIIRFGFRKLNDIFVTNNCDISKFVNVEYFNTDCSNLVEKETDTIISEKKYTFEFENYATNLYTHVSKGTLGDNIVKRLAFDIDLYSTNSDYLKNIFENIQNKITQTDDYIFKIFCKLLNNNFLNYYKSDENEFENLILGVMDNE